jgi:hypothetical protein
VSHPTDAHSHRAGRRSGAHEMMTKSENRLAVLILGITVIALSLLMALKGFITAFQLRAMVVVLLVLALGFILTKASHLIPHYLLIFWIFGTSIPIATIGFPVKADDCLFLILLGKLLYDINLNPKTSRHWRTGIENRIAIYLVIYILAVCFGALWIDSHILLEGVLVWVRLIELMCFFYITHYYYRYSERNVMLFFLVFIVCGLVNITLDFIQHYYYLLSDLPWLGEEYFGRFGFFPSSSEYGPFLVAVIIITFQVARDLSGWFVKLFMVSMLVFEFVGLLTCESRISLLSLLFIACFLSIKRRPLLTLSVITLSITVVPMMLDSLSPGKIQRMLELGMDLDWSHALDYAMLDPSMMVRFQNWPFVYSRWIQHPILGSGPGWFKVLFPSSNLYIFALDNAYLRVLSETGIIGCIAFLALYFGLLKKSKLDKLSALTMPWQKKLSVTLGIIFVALCINGVFIDTFQQQKTVIYIWIIGAMCLRGRPITPMGRYGV